MQLANVLAHEATEPYALVRNKKCQEAPENEEIKLYPALNTAHKKYQEASKNEEIKRYTAFEHCAHRACVYAHFRPYVKIDQSTRCLRWYRFAVSELHVASGVVGN